MAGAAPPVSRETFPTAAPLTNTSRHPMTVPARLDDGRATPGSGRWQSLGRGPVRGVGPARAVGPAGGGCSDARFARSESRFVGLGFDVGDRAHRAGRRGGTPRGVEMVVGSRSQGGWSCGHSRAARSAGARVDATDPHRRPGVIVAWDRRRSSPPRGAVRHRSTGGAWRGDGGRATSARRVLGRRCAAVGRHRLPPWTSHGWPVSRETFRPSASWADANRANCQRGPASRPRPWGSTDCRRPTLRDDE